MKIRLYAVIAIVFALAMFRLLPHPPNVSPVAAMALFGGAFLVDKRMALLVPLLAMLASDFFLGFHPTMVFVYGGMALTVLIGSVLGRHLNAVNTVMAAVAASLLFFFVTNFGVWLTSPMYPASLDGLLQSYVAGLPFFQNTLLGNLFYTLLAFGGFYLLRKSPVMLHQA